jgi:hypothetical protein
MSYRDIFTKIAKSDLFRLDGEEIDLVEEMGLLADALKTEDDWDLDDGMGTSLSGLVISAYWAFYEWYVGGDEVHVVACKLGEIYKPGMECAPKDSGDPGYDEYCAINDWFQRREDARAGRPERGQRYWAWAEGVLPREITWLGNKMDRLLWRKGLASLKQPADEEKDGSITMCFPWQAAVWIYAEARQPGHQAEIARMAEAADRLPLALALLTDEMGD